MTNAIDKVRKLLALARDKGATEAEAASAMAMASRIMLDHNLSEDMIGDKSEIYGGMWGTLQPRWSLWLGLAVGKLYSCQHVFAVLRSSDGKTTNRWIGRELNVRACEETFQFIIDQVEREYKRELKRWGRKLTQPMRAELRKTFKEACAMRVLHRCEEIIEHHRKGVNQHALVVIDDMMVEINRQLDAKKTKRKELAIRSTGIGSGSGYVAGNNIQLQTEVK